METKLTKDVRSYLEWSWNFALAESLAEDTLKGIANWISAGIARGEDASDEDLVTDWLECRVKDFATFELLQPNIWDPRYFAKDNEVPIDSVILLAELQGQPYFSRVLEEVRERRGSEEE